jgi:hypothetical protein
VVDPNLLQVNSADALVCLPVPGCLFTITGGGADALVGTVTGGGAVTTVVTTGLNADVVTGTWAAGGFFNCTAPGASGWLVVTFGTKSTPQIPVDC